MSNQVLFNNHIVLIGFGAMGQSIIPLLFKHFKLKPLQLIIVTDKEQGKEIIDEYKLDCRISGLTPSNYESLLRPLLHSGDLLLNFSVDVSSTNLIHLCQNLDVLYVDLSTEPWAGGYIDPTLPPSERTNYSLREQCIKYKKEGNTTAVITHGANPGLVSHFLKQALLNLARDNQLNSPKEPQTTEEWALLAQRLEIKTIHIAERDTQETDHPYRINEFSNTWSAEGFIGEASQPAELGWGTHERHFPAKGKYHEYGCKAAIYLDQPGVTVRVRSWTPSYGPYHGYLITHAESISIANYLTLGDKNHPSYRPTVHYAYLPCPQAQLSLNQLVCNEGMAQSGEHLLLDDITSGSDELGILLMGNKKGAYWYGSTLSIEETRKLVPHNSATSLQVVSSAIAAIHWAIENPKRGIVEPEELDYKYILEIATPYLGLLKGYYTQWTPLDNRNTLFEEDIDSSDPWQFKNILVHKE